jgi:SAM-dependent methyltransferase
MDSGLVHYYSRRAAVYDEMWHRDEPERLAEQALIANALKSCFAKRRVLEIACGTGFWTGFVAEVAEHICAVDASPEMLALARSKGLPEGRVRLREGDAYALDAIPGSFNGGLANFWFSHVPRARVGDFLRGFHRRLEPGAVVFMADNVYLPGVGGELVTRPGMQDTFKLRELSDGKKYEVLKNYYDAEQLRTILSPISTALNIQIGQHFWWVNYHVDRS